MERRKRRSKRHPLKGSLIVVFLIAVSVILVHFACDGYSEALGKTASAVTRHNVAPDTATNTINSPPRLSRETSDPTGNASARDDLPTFTVPVNVKDITNTYFLELVNKEYGIQDASGSSLVPAWPTVPVLSKNITLNKTALEAIKETFSAASGAHIGSFYISSGYRSYADQARVYDLETDKFYAQTPGHSEHETGLAADIMVTGLTQNGMGSSPKGKWLDENSWEYGLIWRYPQDKQTITGISYEPWHFRYVGQPHAWYCQQNNLCFEEYIEFLKSSGGYGATLDGKKYSVLYEMPKNGIIYVPKGQNYNVSDDNTGGYIVTAWE